MEGKDILQKNFFLKKYSSFHLMENVESGAKDISINIRSPEGPKMIMLVNEGPLENNKLIMRRVKDSRESLLLPLQRLTFGEVEKNIISEDNWIYFSFFSHESTRISVQLTVQSKSKNVFQRLNFRIDWWQPEYNGIYFVRHNHVHHHHSICAHPLHILPQKEPSQQRGDEHEER